MADRSISVALRAEVSGFVAGMRTAQSNTAALTRELEKSAKQRQALGQLGRTAGLVGLGAAAAVAGFVGAAANFDSAMSKIQAATHETAGNMDLLRAAAIQAGQATKYSASEAAEGIEALAKAGVNTTDILHGGLAGALSLAAAGNQSVADSAETAASAMTQFGLSGKEVPHIADLLAAGAGKAQGEVSDMAMALNQVGLVAHQTGLTIEETTGTLAAFASAGLTGSDAGTSFKTMLLRLTPQSKQAAQVMDYLGLSAFDTQGKFIGMANYAQVLHDKLKDMTDQQRQATLTQLFGQDAIRGATALYDKGAQGIQGWIDKTNDAGYAQETASIKMDNLKGDVEQLRGSLETLFITTGEGSQGPLRLMVESLTKITNVLNRLPGPAKDAFLAMLAITALTGGAAWFGTKVIGGIANTRNTLQSLGMSAEQAQRKMTMAGKALRGLGIAGATLAGLEALGAVFTKIQNSVADSVPGVETLTGQLIDLENAGGGGGAVKSMDDLGDAIDRVANKGALTKVSDTLQGTLGGIIGAPAAKSLREAQDEITALDAALANLQQTAGTDTAASAFDDLTTSLGLNADQIADLRNLLPQYKESVAGAANETKLAGTATEGFSGDLGSSVQAMQAADKAMEEMRKKARETAEQFFNIDRNLKNAKVSLGGWIHDMQRSAQDLRDFTKNARDAARRGLDEGLIASLEAAGPAGARRMRQLAGATKEQLAAANRAWRQGQKAIDDYVATVTDVPTVKLRVDIGQVISGVAQATASVQHFINSWGSGGGSKKKGHATGGLVVGPGSATSDDVGIQASNGEYVVRASSVRRYGIGAMNAINEGRPMSVASIATGARDGRTAAALEALNARLASLESIPAAVEAGAQRGSHNGSRQGLAAQGQAVFSQVGY